MLFNSFQFILLVVATLLLYYLPIARSWQVLILTVSSFVFYGSHEPWLLLLLITSVSINAMTSWMVVRGAPKHRRIWAGLGVIANLAILAFFKYAGFFANTFSLQSGVAEFLYTIPLPIGISFFTFQGISLLLDTIAETPDSQSDSIVQDKLKDHFLFTVFYVSFFPQLVAGPIVKANEFLPQIKPKWLKDIDWNYCFRKLVTGYFLKMVIADNLKDSTFWIEYPYFLSRSSVELLAMLFGYSMQIFADFAGYSLIALGVAGLFGYRLPDNFMFPYISTSFSEFWRRWHISLSSWLRDYLYFPLGGSRKSAWRTYFNLFVFMFLGGLWHGAAWSYAIWGTAHGVALAVERSLKNVISLPDNRAFTAFKMMFVFSFVTVAWLFFKLPQIDHVAAYLQAIFSNVAMKPKIATLYYLAIFSLPVVFYHLYYLWKNEKIKKRCEPILLGCMLACLLFNSGSPGAFIYFQF